MSIEERLARCVARDTVGDLEPTATRDLATQLVGLLREIVEYYGWSFSEETLAKAETILDGEDGT